MVNFLEKISTRKSLIILIICYVAVFGGIVYYLQALMALTNYGILDFDFGYSRQRVLLILSSYGTQGMDLYGRIQLLDVINPALYALLLAAITYRLLRQTKWYGLSFLPILAGLLDYAENITLYCITRSFPTVSDGLIAFSSTLSVIKNCVLYIALAALVFALVHYLRFKKRA